MYMRDHALAYARNGWPVFPVSRTKQPMVKGWQHRSEPDLIKVWAWWDSWPSAAIGCATGHIFDVVDLDGPQARAHYEQLALEANHAFTGPISKTGRLEGGWQLFYSPTGMGNRKPTPKGVDFRGHGGFVILSPSVHRTGNVYTWLREPDGTWPELPEPLRTKLFPPRKAPALHHGQPLPREVVGDYRLRRWAEVALDKILAELKSTQRGVGQRNHALNRCGFRAYQLAHVLGEATVTTALYDAAEAIGYVADKGTRRTQSTITSASKGLQSPRYPEDRGTP